MGISLSKGQSISLAKDGGPSLDRIAVGLGWGLREVQKKGFFGFGSGTRKVEVDLDASAIIYGQSGQPVDSVWWRQLRSQEGSVVHTGDDLGVDQYVSMLETVPALKDAVAEVADSQDPAVVACAVELVLEGLHLNKRLNKDAVGARATYRGRG